METIKDLGKYTFPALLANSLKKFSDRPALAIAGETPCTYAEMAKKSQDFSVLLTELGLKPKSKVAILGMGRPEWGISYLGIVNCGMIAVPLLHDFSSTEITAVLEHCQPDAFIVEERFYNKVKDIKSLPSIMIKMDDYSVISGTKTAELTYDELPACEVQEDDTASIIYTSGTTGRSKGVELTHKSLIWNAISCQFLQRVNKLDRCVSFLPLSHVYEFTIGFTMQILCGSSVHYLAKPPVVSSLLPAFKKVQPTIILSVPLIMEKIYKAKILPTFNKNGFIKTLYKFPPTKKILNLVAGKTLKKTFGGKLIFFGIGGSKVDPVVEKFMKSAKFPYAIGYGLTETAPLLAGSGPKITLPGTIGIVIPEVDMQIANPNEYGIGEVCVKGPNVMKGYYKDPELTSTVFTTDDDSCGPGYFKTGDLGILRKKRGKIRLSLKGRSKNMILGPNGENIYPEDLEFVLNQHPLVSESLVVEDDSGLVALVQVDEEKLTAEAEERAKAKLPNFKEMAAEFQENIAYQKEVLMNEIQFFVNSRSNRNSQIRKVQKVDQFEKTASQKIKRYLYDLRTKVSETAEKLKHSKKDKNDSKK